MVETEFVDAESYQGSSNENISYRQIVLQHIKRITELASKEMRGGYYRDIGTGTVNKEEYVPDTRDIYIHAVDCLADLLLPHFDRKMLDAEEKLKEELEQDWKNCTCDGDVSDERSWKNDKKEQFFNHKKYVNKRSLFRELSKFLGRIRYLEGKKWAD